jgi:hypothetical protein
MTIVPLGDVHQVWQVRAQWTSEGFSSGESSWSFVDVRYPGDDGSHLYDLWAANLEPLFMTARPVNWALEQVVVEDRWPNTKPPFVANYGSGLQPDSSGASAPPAATPIITWTSAHPGRSYRGRTYWGPIRMADIDDGWHLGGDAETAVYMFGLAMMDTFGGSLDPSRPVFSIVSRTHDGMPRVPLVFVEVTAFNDRQYLGTVRKRNRAVGIFS